MSNQMSVACKTVLLLGPSATATASDRPPLSYPTMHSMLVYQNVLGNQPIYQKNLN